MAGIFLNQFPYYTLGHGLPRDLEFTVLVSQARWLVLATRDSLSLPLVDWDYRQVVTSIRISCQFWGLNSDASIITLALLTELLQYL